MSRWRWHFAICLIVISAICATNHGISFRLLGIFDSVWNWQFWAANHSCVGRYISCILMKIMFYFLCRQSEFLFFLHKQNSLIGNRYMIYFFLLGHAALTLRSRLRCIVMKKTENSTNSSNRFVCFLKICVLSFWKSCYILFTFFI